MNDQTPRRTSRWLSGVAERVLGGTVTHLSAPGGRERQSLRVHFADRTVIATCRQSAARAENEAAFLMGLNRLDAPVPQVLAFEDGVLFQEDAGRNRLSHAMVHAPGPRQQQDLARAAIDSLEHIRGLIETRPALMDRLPTLGGQPAWREDFVARHVFLSHTLKITPPEVDREALEQALISNGGHFARWDARAGNAAVQPDGRVIWFDWEVFGRREGVEDLAWLIVDDFWMLSPAQTRAALAPIARLADPVSMAHLRRLAVLIAANRLATIEETLRTTGWTTPEQALRYDRVAACAQVLHRVAGAGQSWALEDPTLAPFAPWFDAAVAALLTR